MPDNQDNSPISQSKLKRIREKVLAAEKEKLNLDNPMGILDDIQDIVESEIDR